MICAVEMCERETFAREWCQKHYTRWRRHGDPVKTLNRMDMTAAERIEADIDRRPDGCWLWMGRLNEAGYAVAKDEGSAERLVHRWMYARHVRPISDQEPLDHVCHSDDLTCAGGRTCRHRRCVNPRHLEIVTPHENWRRSRHYCRVIHETNICKRGHDLTVHAYIRRDRPGQRQCRVCDIERARQRRERIAAGAV